MKLLFNPSFPKQRKHVYGHSSSIDAASSVLPAPSLTADS
jgi:hypothetical protein